MAHATCTWLTTHKLAGLYALRLPSAGDCDGGPMMVQLPLPLLLVYKFFPSTRLLFSLTLYTDVEGLFASG